MAVQRVVRIVPRPIVGLTIGQKLQDLNFQVIAYRHLLFCAR
jgi:hypothetical protein